ncbi:MAG: C4-dicarboxylate ABC transporter [Burkholderiales bacterium 35-55-47]|jgi:TRAP-type mannitol/chloroaromatic compound transport system permease large subunit|uniref:TRAP transporter large permease n=1 Tax=Limnohabitans sp. TaxID=1907725 RepID=UPI000BD4DB43|nr:TRAP transporter large permease subunit [Limnohabitans sp.]OYY17848.1 MAG: C4-dicarboxylate ABC transporter [Burkholderiales bacterium 35-55-47]OYZ72215.1 MAG: C4-dicarboxylate ABC transporter [Burkholderiales bacterium 24-55-52]OZA99587.1 MAG: C4-dicarboxylate ABC transporter [Burkholderiales bacterium 39-55-53]HQR86812.1 TRAP transporter large permease subunit [Limnohabitans sp.]HQS27091.1 TRAP transporter large permease subunit [Limnohabitans sp.]
MKKEIWFGLSIMAMVVLAAFVLLPPVSEMTNGHLGLLMLALVVVAIMLGFPTAFTLMGMGMIFAWLAYRSQNPELAVTQTLDLMVQRTYSVMSNDVLISIPLFVFMGYLIERANLIEKLFKSMHLATARVPGSLAVATIITCAIFATATGIVGAVVTLMGLLALPAMLRAGYSVQLSAGAITAGGCLGILIPPSVMLIVYGATAGVSVVKLYAGAFFPGLMLATLYLAYVIILAKLKPHMAPPMSAEDRYVPLPPVAHEVSMTISDKVLPGLIGAIKGKRNAAVPMNELLKQLGIALLPAISALVIMGAIFMAVTAPAPLEETQGVVAMGEGFDEAPSAEEEGALAEPEGDGLQAPPGTDDAAAKVVAEAAPSAQAAPAEPAAAQERLDAPASFWIGLVSVAVALAIFYAYFSFARLEIFKMLLGSFFPLAIMILAVLGTIVFGLATPTEAAAMGSMGGLLLAGAYRRLNMTVMRESVYLTAKTSAMVCWLFVGSSIFSAAFALLGGQELINTWVLGMDLTPTQFMILAQVVIFLLGWPLEWTEIIVIFMPIFIPLLPHFNIDPLFFGLLVALNLQTAFLSPPVAMAAFYLKGVSPPHVTLNQIFAGMLPFMAIQVFAIFLLYMFPAIGMWLPNVLYK